MVRRALLVLLALAAAREAAALPGPGKPAAAAKLGHELARLHEAAVAPGVRRPGLRFQREDAIPVRDGAVLVDAVAAGAAAVLRADLAALGATRLSSYGAVVSALVPIARLAEVGRLASLASMRPARAVAHAGAVTSQGDAALRGPPARDAYDVDGAGVTVGTLSDSYDCEGGAAADVASGDLPGAVVVLDEGPCVLGAADEGRAMMQLVHDVAPGARQAFHTAFEGQASFASGILELALQADARVIADDVIYLAEPMFQDGVVAQAVDAVAGLGVAYFSAAGNGGRRAYEAPFVAGDALPADAFEVAPGVARFYGGTAHDFGGGDAFQRIAVPDGVAFTLAFQWDAPFLSVGGGDGAPNDLDVYVLDDPPSTVLAAGVDANLGLDPVEIVDFVNPSGSGVSHVNLLIVRFSGPNPGWVKYVRFGGSAIEVLEHDTRSGTVYGHAAARGALAVGAAFYAETPSFGVTPPLLEPFSSGGPATIRLSREGLPALDVRRKPDLVAPDGADTTFFVPGDDVEPNGWPNFFGTSAAAPHAAGVAALVAEAVPGIGPESVRSVLAGSALDMASPGLDDDTGAGLIRADAALGALHCRGRRATIVGTSGDDDLVGTRRDDVIVALRGDDRVRGAGGSDLVCGGPGGDRLSGNAGHDVLDGGPGKDELRGGPDDDRLLGGGGDDLLDGGGGRDVLSGGAGSDLCLGGERTRGCP